MSFISRTLACTLLSTGPAIALAHVGLPPGPAVAGSPYEARFRVGHACQGAHATTALTVQLPRGFTLQDVPARAGWTSTIDRSGDGMVRWTADSAAQALPGDQKSEFVLRGQLPAEAGTLYFKVLQTCDVGKADWAQIPGGSSADASREKLEFPAARLLVVAPGAAPVEATGAWLRAAVPGQSATGGFMKLTAGVPLRLVGVSTPAAGVAEVHEMKMEGDVMKMSELPNGIAIPAGATVELKPKSLHVMFMDIKSAPVAEGQEIKGTLTFEKAGTVEIEYAVEAADAGMN